MKDTWLRLTSIFLFLLYRYSIAVDDDDTCVFPQSEIEPFFFDTKADILPDSVIVDSIVEPPNAKLEIVNIRSNNLPQIDFIKRFSIVARDNGQFMLINRDKLILPDFPSRINETYLYITISCNHKAYPLITIRIRNYNTWTPRFYMNKDPPYEMTILEDTPPGTIIDTPILAIDRDPSTSYTISYDIVSGLYKKEFNLSASPTLFHRLQTLPKSLRDKHFLPEQLPAVVQLRVLERLKRGTYYLNISANDNGVPPKIAYTTLKLIVKSSQSRKLEFSEVEYHTNFTISMPLNSEFRTDFPLMAKLKGETYYRNEKPPTILYELLVGDYNEYFHLDPRSAKLTLRKKFSENAPPSIQLKIKAYLESDFRITATTVLWLSDISETVIAFFTLCSYNIKLKENAYPGTEVIRLQYKGYVDHFELLNAQEYFDVHPDGTVIVKEGLDREKIEKLDFRVKLVPLGVNQPQPVDLCHVATVKVTVEDVNDNTPKCEKLNHVFYAEEVPFNNTEIGRVKASDIDKSHFGQVKYRILGNDLHDLPFTIFDADGVGTIYYVTYYSDFFPDNLYSFTVEAYDMDENPKESRACRMAVQVVLGEDEMTTQVDSNLEENNQIRARAKAKASNHIGSTETSSLEVLAQSESSDDFHPDLPEFHSKGNLNNFEATTDHRLPRESQESDVPKTRIFPKSSEENLKNEIRRTPMKNTNSKQKELALPKVIKFEKDVYKFKVYGVLDEGRYVGTIRVPDAKGIEYALEEGILGFFHLDPLTGYLSIGEELLKDLYEEVRFSAVAKRNGRDLATTLITVYLDESVSIFEVQPQFEQALYRFEIQESAPPQDIGQVTAHHRSIELGNDQADYELTVNEDSRKFSIDSETGMIRNEEYFDWETQKLYTFQVSACLRKNRTLCEEADVIVVVLDVNDNPPEFSQSSYSVTLPQDIPPNTEIFRVNASDRDSGKNAQIHYKIDDVYDLFKIDEKTGGLSLKRKFPDTDDGHYSLSISAEDEGDPPLKGYATVNIETGSNEINPSAPEFEKFRYDDIILNAPVPANMEILTVHANDPDPGPSGDIKYHIDMSNGAQPNKKIRKFAIDENNGKIFTIQKITADDGPVIQFVVEAVDQSPNYPRKTQTVVMLTVNGEAREFIEFNPLPKIVFISTDKPVGSPIISVSAISNINKTIEFSLRNPNKFFGMAENQLVVKSPLSEGHYNVTIKAMIEDTNLFTEHRMKIVVMTDRDKYPVFEKLGYNFEVPINSVFPLKLPPVNATVRNGHITYEIYRKEKLPRGISIDKITGQLTIFEEFVPVFNAQGNMFVVIRARNVDYQTFFSDVGVTLKLVDINSIPAFTSKLYRLVMPENTFPGAVISEPLPLKKPEEFSNVEWSISPSDKFSIAEDGSIVVNEPIDLEKMDPALKGIVDLTVTAKSGNHTSSTKVQIKIEDINEETPAFSQTSYKFNANSNISPGDVIGLVNAKDSDVSDKDNISYRIFDDDPNPQFRGFFQINSRTGEISLTNKEPRIPRTYSLRIEAADAQIPPNTGLVRVDITINNQQPTSGSNVIDMPMEKWEITDEEKIIGSNIVIHGLPNANWEFQIVGGNEAENFRLRRLNDTMSMVEILTAPSEDNQTLVIQGVNIDNPSQIIRENISVDLTKLFIPQFVSDNKPITATISMPTFIPIFTVFAEQPSNRDPITYSLENNPREMFWVDPNNGSVYFCCSEGRHDGVYEVEIKATALNENTGTSYSSKNTGPPSIRTSSSNSGITFINLPPTSITLQVPSPSTSELIDLVHFESSQYTFPITQRPFEGMKIGDIYLLNFKNTTPIHMHIIPEEFEPFFDIDFAPQAGTVTLFLKRIPPFAENLNIMEFNVTLDDMLKERRSVTEVMILWGSESTTTAKAVSVVTDENGTFLSPSNTRSQTNTVRAQPPTISTRSQPALTSRTIPTSQTLISTFNNISTTSSNSTPFPTKFITTRIATNGPISTENNILNNVSTTSTPSNTVISNGTPPSNNITQVTSNSRPASTNIPPLTNTGASISENLIDGIESSANVFTDENTRASLSTTRTLPSTQISRMNVSNQTSYERTASTNEQAPTTTISTSNLITDNIRTEFMSTSIFITSTTPGINTITNILTSTISEENNVDENHANGSFSFVYPQYTAIVPEGRYSSGGSLITIKPQRLAMGLPSNVEYRIFSVDTTLPFFIRSDNGEVFVFGTIDREKTPLYNLTIMALDSAQPPNAAKTQVIVQILDVNDNYPLFINPPHVIPVAATMPVGTNLYIFNATDYDNGRSGNVSFRLAENYHDLFAINNNGVLILAKEVPEMDEENVSISIEAVDGGRPALRASQKIGIKIFPQNMSQPMFLQTDDTVTLPPSASTGTFIKQLVAGTVPLAYGITNNYSKLFSIDNNGVITLGRMPKDDERNTFYDLNITATDQNGKSVSTILHVNLEGIPGQTTRKPTAAACRFPVKIYNAEVRENTIGRTKLTKLTSSCEIEKKPVKYVISQGADMFEVDENTGEVYVTKELDRENKSVHFIIVNATDSTTTRKIRQLNPIAEFTRNKLADNQALIVVRVIDQNDNPPVFQRRNSNNEYVFNVDWQSNLLRPIARVEAHDADEKPQLRYSIYPDDYFTINATHGVIYVKKSLSGLEEEMFELIVEATDGNDTDSSRHTVSTPVKIYVLAPGINLVVLGVEQKPEDIDDLAVERKLTEQLGFSTHVLIKQIFLQDDGKPDENKSHLFVYATDKNNVPLSSATLKDLIEKVAPKLKESGDLPVMNITIPAVYRKLQLSIPEIILLILSAILLFTACITLFFLLRYCKRRFMLTKSDTEYMVDSTSAGPRPYNVELISRKTAQTLLSSRSLPDPYEEIKMSPESRATMIAASGLLVTDNASTATSHRNEAINPITGSTLLLPADQSEGESSPGSTLRPPSTAKSIM